MGFPGTLHHILHVVHHDAHKAAHEAGGFVHGFATNAEDLIGGIPAGLAALPKVVEHPKLAGKAIVNSYDKNSALVSLAHGHFNQAYHRAQKAPLDTLLDAGSLAAIGAAPFTEGASLAVGAAVDGSRTAKILQALSGLDHVGDAAKVSELLQPTAATVHTADDAAMLKMLARGRKIVKRNGKVFVPKTRTLVGRGVKAGETGQGAALPRNLAVRARKITIGKVLDSIIPADSALGVNTRIDKAGIAADTLGHPAVANAKLKLYKTLLDKMERKGTLQRGMYVHVLRTAGDMHDPHAILDAYKASNDKAITALNVGVKRTKLSKSERVLLDELKSRRALYSDHAALDAAMNDKDVQRLSALAHEMGHSAHVQNATSPIRLGEGGAGPEGLAKLARQESEHLGVEVGPHDPGWTPRSKAPLGDKGKEFQDRVKTLRTSPDATLRSKGRALQAGVDEIDPRIYAHAYAQAHSVSTTQRKTMRAFEAAVPSEDVAGKIDSRRLLTPSSAAGKHLTQLRAMVAEIPEGARNQELPQRIIAAHDKMMAADKAGKELVIPQQLMRHVVRDTPRSAGALAKVMEAPNSLWRAFVLPLRPAWMANNLMSNIMLLGLAHGGQGYMHLFQSATKAGRASTPTSVIEHGLYNSERYAGKGKILRAVTAPSNHLSGFNAAVVENPFRRAAYLSNVKGLAKLASKDGESWQEAAARLESDAPQVVEALANKTNKEMVDFRSLPPEIRNNARLLIPFVNWLYGSTERALTLSKDEPLKAALLQQLGHEGERQNANLLDQPDFVRRGAVQLGQEHKGVLPFLSLYGANPFSTQGDLAGMFDQLVNGPVGAGGENPASQFGPSIKVPYESFVSGKDTFTGKPLPNRSPLVNVLSQYANGIPAYKLLTQDLPIADTKKGYEKMYQRRLHDLLLDYIGYNEKHLNVQAGRDAASFQKAGPHGY